MDRQIDRWIDRCMNTPFLYLWLVLGIVYFHPMIFEGLFHRISSRIVYINIFYAYTNTHQCRALADLLLNSGFVASKQWHPHVVSRCHITPFISIPSSYVSFFAAMKSKKIRSQTAETQWGPLPICWVSHSKFWLPSNPAHPSPACTLGMQHSFPRHYRCWKSCTGSSRHHVDENVCKGVTDCWMI